MANRVDVRLIAASFAVVLAGCDVTSIGSEEIIGRVVNETGKPIPNALVLGRWVASYHSSHGGTACLRNEVVKADATGSFKISAWSLPANHSPATLNGELIPYAPGYTEAPTSRAFPSRRIGHALKTSDPKYVLAMAPDSRQPKARIDGEIVPMIDRANCESQNAAILFRALADEIKRIPEADRAKSTAHVPLLLDLLENGGSLDGKGGQ